MLIIVKANEKMAEKIYKKHLRRVYHLRYSRVNENEDAFLWCTSRMFASKKHEECVMNGTPIIQWIVRHGKIMYFSLQKDGYSYRIDEPTGKIKNRLRELSEKAEKRFWKGYNI